MERRYYNRELESMSREDMLALQWQKLKKQIEYCYQRCPFYRRKFAEAGITPDDIKSREDYAMKVPAITKADLIQDQQESPPYGTRLATSENELYYTYLTSGTSGRGQEVHSATRGDIERMNLTFAMGYYWAGWEKGDPVMTVFPMGTAIGGVAQPWGMQALNCNTFMLGPYDTKAKLDYMKRFNIKRMMVVPAYLQAMTAEVMELGYDPAKDFAIETIMRATAPYPIAFVERMAEVWNAKLYDFYGSTQIQGMASNCENGPVWKGKRGFYHWPDYMSYAEVIDHETGELVAPGEEGELIVTTLDKEASPILRFKSEDRVRLIPDGECDCGRPFTLIEAGTVARYDDMLKIRGVNVWADTVDEVILTKEEVREYKASVYISDKGREEVDISVEFKGGVAPDTKQRVMEQCQKELRDKTGLRMDFKEAAEKLEVAVGALGKARRWKDERAKGLERKGT